MLTLWHTTHQKRLAPVAHTGEIYLSSSTSLLQILLKMKFAYVFLFTVFFCFLLILSFWMVFLLVHISVILANVLNFLTVLVIFLTFFRLPPLHPLLLTIFFTAFTSLMNTKRGKYRISLY